MIDHIVHEIKESVDNKCFISALALALTLPDICGRAEYPSERSSRKRYVNWYKTYVEPFVKPSDPYGSDMPYLSGEVVYQLRCSLLHLGTPGIIDDTKLESRCKADRFVLEITDAYDSGTSMVAYGKDRDIVQRELTVSVLYLISKLAKEAKNYYLDQKDKFDFFSYEWKDRRTPNSVLWFDE